MSDKGWIKLHRQIQEHWIWEEKPFDRKSAWIDLILSANHQDKKILFNGSVITISKGSFLTSIRKLAEKWGWSRNKTYAFLETLENEQMINKSSNGMGTLLTIVKYSDFQHSQDTESTTQKTTQKTRIEQQKGHALNTNKNVKNDKECKEEKNMPAAPFSENDPYGWDAPGYEEVKDDEL